MSEDCTMCGRPTDRPGLCCSMCSGEDGPYENQSRNDDYEAEQAMAQELHDSYGGSDQ